MSGYARQVRRGFTLIELMVVVALLGIMASLAVGLSSDTVARERAREDVEAVRAHLVAARNHARRNAACVEVRRTDARTLTAAVVVDLPNGCPTAPHAQPPPTPTTTLRAATSITPFDVAGTPLDAVRFGKDGSVPLEAPATLQITTAGVPPTTLAVWPAAGIVKKGAP